MKNIARKLHAASVEFYRLLHIILIMCSYACGVSVTIMAYPNRRGDVLGKLGRLCIFEG